MKQALQDTFEAVVEQVVGPKQKPQQQIQQPQQKKTLSLSEQLSTKDLNKAIFGGLPNVTPEEYQKKLSEEKQKTNQQINEPRQVLEEEKKQAKRGNIEIINPPKPQQPPTPAYISGKPEYNPERQAKMEKDAHKLPELPMPKGKPPRGSWLSSMERKKHGAEIKGGRE